MKKMILAAVLLSSQLAFSAYAETTLNADYLCQQDEGDQWYEAAIIPHAPVGYDFVVIKHNDDDSSEVFYKTRGFEFESTDSYTLFTDEKGGILLIGNETENGIFVVKNPNGSILKLGGLICHRNSEIILP